MNGEYNDGVLSLDQVNVQPNQYHTGFDAITTQPIPASEIDTVQEVEEEKKKKKDEDVDDTCDSCCDDYDTWDGICEMFCCVCLLLSKCDDDD